MQIGVTSGRPALIEFLEVQGAGPTIVPKGRYSGWFDIGGRRLFLRCTGHRSPTVVFEGGLTTDWYELQNQLSGFTRVCSYDRPGGPAEPKRPRPHPADRPRLRGRPARPAPGRPRPGPYVLAGHSNSGLFSQLYASTHPRQVAGLVLIDAVHPAYHKRRLALLKPLLPPEVWEALRQEAMIPCPIGWSTPRGSTSGPVNARPGWRCAAPRCGRCRWSCSPTAPRRPAPPGWPVEEEEPLWRQLQRELAQLVPGGRLVIATQSGHNIQDEQPELVLDAIRDVVLAVRAGDLVPH